ncbi:hypothetical protein [Novilysobacter antarcticus]|uniref:hypothetical protein n=1 Tax=Novilysobacter antarcticus TaxID=2862543 RepID=UPI001C992665|nr:hypothetical protein [Lysobacter antarcticus]
MRVECAVAEPHYLIGEADGIAEARNATIQAWRDNLSGPDDVHGQRFDALFDRSPFGEPALRFLEDGRSRRKVGVALLAPRVMSLGDDRIRVGVVSHLAIDAEHRSLGPAVMLLEALLADGKHRFDFIYGLPRNSEGADAALKRAGLRPVGVMERHVKVLRHGRYLARRMPALLAPLAQLAGWAVDLVDSMRETSSRSGLKVEWTHAADGRMDEIWARSGPGMALTATRDTRMLGWRFDRSADPSTRYVMVSDARSGDALAWFACEVDPKWPHTLDVQDFWSADSGGRPALELVEALVRHARSEGYSAISIHVCVPDGGMDSWRLAGFVERGKQRIFGRWLNRELSTAGSPDLHFTNIDLDG